MEAEVYYIAKDGRRFKDPLLCEQYEKTIGHEYGTVGRAKIDLKALGENTYLSGLLAVNHEGRNGWFCFATFAQRVRPFVQLEVPDDSDADAGYAR